MAVQIKVNKSIINPLLNRKEVELTVHHTAQATPAKELIRSELCSNYSVPAKQIYVFDLKTGFGSHETTARAHLYSSLDDLKKIERAFVVAKMTGESKKKTNRRQRKTTRIKRYKMFGTLKRNMKKAARRNKDE